MEKLIDQGIEGNWYHEVKITLANNEGGARCRRRWRTIVGRDRLSQLLS